MVRAIGFRVGSAFRLVPGVGNQNCRQNRRSIVAEVLEKKM